MLSALVLTQPRRASLVNVHADTDDKIAAQNNKLIA